MIKLVVLKIYGRVQGIMFRDSTRRRAKKLNLVGWVKNEPDGTVIVFAQGEEKNLKELINWCYNGPILAKVDKIDIEWRKAKKKFKGFEIKRECDSQNIWESHSPNFTYENHLTKKHS